MEKLNFVFRKSRNVDTLIGDYIHLFKKIFKHFNRSIFQFLLPVIAVFVLIIFFTFSLGSNVFYNATVSDSTAFSVMMVLLFIVALFYFMFVPTFGIEYMFLLEERDACDFTAKDVVRRVRSHLGKYLLFFLASIVVGIILAIPIGIVSVILGLIPILGTFALGIFMACLIVLFNCALYLYLTGRERVFQSFIAAFRLIKKKFFIYGITAYLFQLMTEIILGLLTLIPIIILVIIAYNTVGFHAHEIFTSFSGKILVSIGSTILLIFTTIVSVYLYSFYVLIFFSSLEDTYKEGTLDIIDTIGSDTKDEN